MSAAVALPPKRRKRRKPNIVGKQQTISARAVQARKILEMRWRGATWQIIADEVGMTRRACQEVFKRETEAGHPEFLELDQVAILKTVVKSFQSDIRILEAIVEDAIGFSNLSVAVGAMKAKSERLDRIVALLQHINILPKHLGDVGVVVDFQALALSMIQMVDAFERGDKSADEVTMFFRKHVKIGPSGRQRLADIEGTAE